MTGWEQILTKWQNAGLIDAEAAARIREFENRESKSGGLRWPAIAAIALGGIMLAAGVLLFVSAHWEEIAPSSRFALAIFMVAILHAAGAFAGTRMEAMATALHGIGTASLGAGIYLCGQIFNMSEHWPSAILTWAAGAWIGWALRRDWVQLAFAALLTPAWLGAEWVDWHPANDRFVFSILSQGMLLLSITYFSAANSKPLLWIGGIALIPWTIALALANTSASKVDGEFLGYAAAYSLPLLLAIVLRRKLAWINGISAVWVLILSLVASSGENPFLYFWCGLGAAGLVAWGLAERRGERINLGMVGFAITILFFYFSSVMDKLGRSASLIGLGVLFLAGGWALEMLRRRLIARLEMIA
jgi:uncharacterized membrane protein